MDTSTDKLKIKCRRCSTMIRISTVKNGFCTSCFKYLDASKQISNQRFKSLWQNLTINPIKRINNLFKKDETGTDASEELDASMVMLGNEPYDIRFLRCMKLVNHSDGKVRRKAVWEIISSSHNLERERLVVRTLAERVINDSSEDVRSASICSMLQQLMFSSKSMLGIETYPEVLQAFVNWFNNLPKDQDPYLVNINLLPDHFFWSLCNTAGYEEVILALSKIAEDKTRKERDRNEATIVLRRLKNKRCIDILKRLSEDTLTYVSSNAKEGLKELEVSST